MRSKTSEGFVDVTLSSNFGRNQTVLLFFPLAFSSVCTAEMCEVSSGLEAFTGLNAKVYGISVDSPYSQEAWAKQNKISVPLLSDLNKTVIQAYDVVFPNMAGAGDSAARAAFVVGTDGIIQYAEQTPTPKDLPDFDAIKAALA